MDKEKSIQGLIYIDIFSMAKDVLRQWWVILMIAVSAYLLVRVYDESRYVPEYTTSATFAVTARGMNKSLYEDLTSATEVAEKFATVIESAVFDRKIADLLGEEYIPAKKSVTLVPETNLIELKVTGKSAMNAYRVTRAVVEDYSIVSDYVIKDVMLDVIQQPKVPTGPSNAKPGTKRAKRAGVLMGALMALYFAVFSYFKDTVKNERDAKNKLVVQTLGTVAHEGSLLSLRKNPAARGKLITNPVLSFRFVETTKLMAARVENRMERRNARVLSVLSVAENEGKSTIAANIAIHMAQSGRSVILIDCDFRKPSQNKLFEMHPEDVPDFTEAVISGKIPESMIWSGDVDGLFVIANNHPTKDVESILHGAYLKSIIDFCRSKADYVILDMAPVGLAPETEDLIEYSDAVVIVVREDVVLASDINEAIEVINSRGEKVLGTVLNYDWGGIGHVTGSYGYGYGYGYNYGRYGGYYGKHRS